MNLFLASIFLGIVPMVLYALIVWRMDRWEKEPIPLLLASFLWGAIPSVIFGVISQLIMEIPVSQLPTDAALSTELYLASFIAPVTEEFAKGIGLVLLFIFARREIDSVLDGLVYGSVIGFGFAAVENAIYFMGQPDPASLVLIFIFRAFVFGMLHALFTGLLGVGLALGKFSKNPMLRLLWPLLGLILAMGSHALHNYFATLGGELLTLAIGGVSIGIIWFLITFTVCLWHERRWIQIQLAPEVAEGVLFRQQALDSMSYWHRSPLASLIYGFHALQRGRLLHEAAELAFEKQRQSRRGITPKSVDRLARLRARVHQLSRRDPLYLSGEIQEDRRLPPPLPPTRRARDI